MTVVEVKGIILWETLLKVRWVQSNVCWTSHWNKPLRRALVHIQVWWFGENDERNTEISQLTRPYYKRVEIILPAPLQQHCTFEVDVNSQLVYFKNLLNAGSKNMLEQKKVILSSFVDK